MSTLITCTTFTSLWKHIIAQTEIWGRRARVPWLVYYAAYYQVSKIKIWAKRVIFCLLCAQMEEGENDEKPDDEEEGHVPNDDAAEENGDGGDSDRGSLSDESDDEPPKAGKSILHTSCVTAWLQNRIPQEIYLLFLRM